MSFDGFSSQRFEDTQVIVSLPIIDGLGTSELGTICRKGEKTRRRATKEPPVKGGDHRGPPVILSLLQRIPCKAKSSQQTQHTFVDATMLFISLIIGGREMLN